MFPAMPFEVVYEPLAVSIQIHELGLDTLFRMTNELEPDVTKRIWKKLDVYALRDAFLAVKTECEALDFLIAAGGFRARYVDAPEDRLLWSDFRHWQTVIRSIMSSGPLPDDVWFYDDEIDWIDLHTDDEIIRLIAKAAAEGERVLSVHPRCLVIGPDGGSESTEARRRLRAEIKVASLLEGMLATTFLDGLNGTEHRLCGLPDCQMLYEVNSKYERQYCSQPCARKASVRRRRAFKEMKPASRWLN
jgi:hypothetical protein